MSYETFYGNAKEEREDNAQKGIGALKEAMDYFAPGSVHCTKVGAMEVADLGDALRQGAILREALLSAHPAPSQSARELWATLCNGKPNTKDWHHIGDKFTDIEAVALIAKHDRDERELVIEECKTRLKSKVANDNCLTLDDIETILDALKEES